MSQNFKTYIKDLPKWREILWPQQEKFSIIKMCKFSVIETQCSTINNPK